PTIDLSTTILIGIERIFGGSGSDTIIGTPGDDVIEGGTSNDVLYGGAGNDSYVFQAGDGRDTVEEASEIGSDDLVQYEGSITRNDLWFWQSGDDLVIYRLGSTDKITVRYWFSDPTKRIERIAASGAELPHSNVQVLVDAMVPYGEPASGVMSLTTEQQQVINVAIEAAWD
ncbi:MAG: hypothetical protein GY934_07250, partial [Gammaproteobacteria bacterium]|nr:hypothetical protein [Gammaproteobacteria bacterium]